MSALLIPTLSKSHLSPLVWADQPSRQQHCRRVLLPAARRCGDEEQETQDKRRQAFDCCCCGGDSGRTPTPVADGTGRRDRRRHGQAINEACGSQRWGVAPQRKAKKAVPVHFSSKQLPPFGFALRGTGYCHRLHRFSAVAEATPWLPALHSRHW